MSANQRAIPLRDCIRSCEASWIHDYEDEAQNGSIDAQIILSQLLMRGAGGYRPRTSEALDYLKIACRHSAEAAVHLGKLYMNGRRVRQDLEEAYFYLRLATLFRCKCGKYK